MKTVRIFDLSQPVFDGCPNCPVHPPVEISRIADHPGEGWRMELMRMASHTGTHLDAPLHKIAGGASIDQLSLETFTGPPVIADFDNLPPRHPIGGRDLERVLKVGDAFRGHIVLLNTGWGDKRAKTGEWLHGSPYLAPDGAEWLVARGITGVGIDHYSIGGTSEPDNTRTHEILLGSGVWVVEDLCFREGWREAADGASFQALPLLLPGFSGSPCRAVLILQQIDV